MKDRRGMARLKIFIWITIFTLGFSTLALDMPKTQAASYNRNNLCSDSAFINKSALTLTGIQSFLVAKGSFLRNYSEGGRTAAKIIYDAAQAYGINPIAIMATIQKEEGLIYGTYAQSYNQTRMDWAMGYGYTDSEILQQYKGFPTQIDNGTWQLRRNYDYWAINGSVWNVGRSMTIDGVTVTFANRCTSSLYRYTPHLGGNYNFWYYFTLWSGTQPTLEYSGTYISRDPVSPATVQPNQTFDVTVTYKNTGTATWYNSGDYPVRLGTQYPQDRTSAFFDGSRLNMTQASVAPGETATFTGTFTAPLEVGTYVENFVLVADNKTWFDLESGMRWVFYVTGDPVDDEEETPPDIDISQYNAARISQAPRDGNITLTAGQTIRLWTYYRNTGQATWVKTGDEAVELATQDPLDRVSSFMSGTRFTFAQASALPGRYTTFYLTFKAPTEPGTYIERFQPVAGGVPFGDITTWTITVR